MAKHCGCLRSSSTRTLDLQQWHGPIGRLNSIDIAHGVFDVSSWLVCLSFGTRLGIWIRSHCLVLLFPMDLSGACEAPTVKTQRVQSFAVGCRRPGQRLPRPLAPAAESVGVCAAVAGCEERCLSDSRGDLDARGPRDRLASHALTVYSALFARLLPCGGRLWRLTTFKEGHAGCRLEPRRLLWPAAGVEVATRRCLILPATFCKNGVAKEGASEHN